MKNLLLLLLLLPLYSVAQEYRPITYVNYDLRTHSRSFKTIDFTIRNYDTNEFRTIRATVYSNRGHIRIRATTRSLIYVPNTPLKLTITPLKAPKGDAYWRGRKIIESILNQNPK